MKAVETMYSPADQCRGDDKMENNVRRLNERVRGRRRRVLRKRSSLSVQSASKARGLHGKQSEKNREDDCVAGEIRDYLSKLHEIVPLSRKHKRLSRLQVLTNAIDYIRQLRQTLGLPPCISSPGNGQLDHHHLSPYCLPTSQGVTNEQTSSQDNEYHTKSEANVWLVSMACSPSYNHDNESSTSPSSSPSHPAIP